MEFTQAEKQLLKRQLLFKGLSDDDFARALSLLEAEKKSFRGQELLKDPGSPFRKFGLVLSGLIQVYSVSLDGSPVLMAGVTPGHSFAESLCLLERTDSVFAQAAEDSVVLFLRPLDLRRQSPLSSEHDKALALELSSRLTALVAERTLALNRRIQILSKHTLRAKLLTFFYDYGTADGRPFLVPFSRQSMADYLGSDRSALSRELARMKEEGLIDYRGNCFAVLKTE